MKHVYIYSYNSGSQGAAELARVLDISRVRHENSRFKGGPHKTVINWGSTEIPPQVKVCRVLNRPGRVKGVTNKLIFFNKMTDAPDPPRCVPWTTSHQFAYDNWIVKEMPVVCRTILTGRSGNGILIATHLDKMVVAPLYTQYVKKSHEFRVHILAGEIVDFQQKVRDPDREPTNWKVRSHDNGFIFQRTGVTLPEDVRAQSLKAFVASGLDFGAVDVIYSEKQNKAWVLEINSAPGIQNSTVDSYRDAFLKIFSKGT